MTFRNIIFALCFSFGMQNVKADQIDRLMVAQAEELVQSIRMMGGKNYAVLKFVFKIQGKDESLDAGTINTRMVNRLESLLILQNKQAEYMVLTSAGQEIVRRSQQSKQPITWLTKEGRKEIASIGKLPIAWDGVNELVPDAFVTGEVVSDAELRNTTVNFYGFLRSAPTDLKKLYMLHDDGHEKIRTDRSMLASFGKSFSLNFGPKSRSLGMEADDSEAAADSKRRESQGTKHPTDKTADGLNPCPIKLEIYVDNQLYEWQDEKGTKQLRMSPKEGQRVYFRITNTSSTQRFGVILAVDGKNTNAIDRDSLTDKAVHEQRKWVLEPNDSYKLEGFYTDTDGTYEPFQVIPETASEKLFSQLDPMFRGKISLLVFGQRPLPENPMILPAKLSTRLEQQDKQATSNAVNLSGGIWKIRNQGSLIEAQKILSKSAHVEDKSGKLVVSSSSKVQYTLGKRGLIESAGEQRNSGKIVKIPFECDPMPVACMHITYYSVN